MEMVGAVMPFVVAGLVLVGVLCLIDMLLTFAVLRRLREHTARLAEIPDFTMNSGPEYAAKFAGRPLPAFSARAIDGAEVSTPSLTGRPGLVAVFSAGCGPCRDQYPVFADWAGVADANAMALVTGPDGREAAEMTGRLAGVSVVVAGAEADTLADTLGVTVFPTFLQLDDAGVVVKAETNLSMMPIVDPAELARR